MRVCPSDMQNKLSLLTPRFCSVPLSFTLPQMETTKKKSLFFKGRLTKSLYSRVTAKPRPTTTHQQSSKVVPYSHASSNQSAGSYEQTTLPNPTFSTQRVSYASFNTPGFYDHNANKTWGPGDENVDMKAASFISTVRERFKLDRVD